MCNTMRSHRTVLARFFEMIFNLYFPSNVANVTLQYYPSTADCPKRKLTCDRFKCIDVRKRCDGEADCVDGSDEAENICRKSETS